MLSDECYAIIVIFQGSLCLVVSTWKRDSLLTVMEWKHHDYREWSLWGFALLQKGIPVAFQFILGNSQPVKAYTVWTKNKSIQNRHSSSEVKTLVDRDLSMHYRRSSPEIKILVDRDLIKLHSSLVS